MARERKVCTLWEKYERERLGRDDRTKKRRKERQRANEHNRTWIVLCLTILFVCVLPGHFIYTQVIDIFRFTPQN